VLRLREEGRESARSSATSFTCGSSDGTLTCGRCVSSGGGLGARGGGNAAGVSQSHCAHVLGCGTLGVGGAEETDSSNSRGTSSASSSTQLSAEILKSQVPTPFTGDLTIELAFEDSYICAYIYTYKYIYICMYICIYVYI